MGPEKATKWVHFAVGRGGQGQVQNRVPKGVVRAAVQDQMGTRGEPLEAQVVDVVQAGEPVGVSDLPELEQKEQGGQEVGQEKQKVGRGES